MVRADRPRPRARTARRRVMGGCRPARRQNARHERSKSAYLTALVDYSDILVPGERGRLPFLAQNTKQAAVAFGYSAAIFENVPLLKGLVANQTADTISLTNGVDLEVRAASFRGIRGITAIGVIADEVAFWYDSESPPTRTWKS